MNTNSKSANTVRRDCSNALDPGRDEQGRFAAGNGHRWSPGRSGNPGGRPKGASVSAALARQAVTPGPDRDES